MTRIVQSFKNNFSFTTENMIALAIGLAVFLAFLFLRKPLARLTTTIIGRIMFFRHTDWRLGFQSALFKPLGAFYSILGLYLGLFCLGISEKSLFWGFVTKWYRILIICVAAWAIANFISACAPFFLKLGKNVDAQVNKTATSFISNILKVIVILLGGVIVISELGYNINGLITGLGLGGMTIALAAKDSASNLFGGLIIVLDKPFEVGDWITTPDVDGVVEDITIRSTRVRTFANSLIVVPNATLANQSITNWSRMNKRRIKFNIGLKYNTSSQLLHKCCGQIKHAILTTPGIEQDSIMVAFDQFEDSALSILILCFTETIEWEGYMKLKEEILYKIKGIIERNQAEFAFPSQSVYIEEEESNMEQFITRNSRKTRRAAKEDKNKPSNKKPEETPALQKESTNETGHQ